MSTDLSKMSEWEQIQKLPKWAQILIERQARDIKHHRRQALAVARLGSPGGTDVVLSDGTERHGLPPGSQIRFTIDEKPIEVGIVDRGRGPRLEVRAEKGLLHVQPVSGNVVCITAEDF